jgi:hypothetical protein
MFNLETLPIIDTFAATVRENYGSYQDTFGVGPCGPVSAILAYTLRREGLDARLISAMYRYGPGEYDENGHYTVGVYNPDGTLTAFVDTTNLIEDGLPTIIPRDHPHFARYQDLYDLGSGRANPDYNVWGQDSISWWIARLPIKLSRSNWRWA